MHRTNKQTSKQARRHAKDTTHLLTHTHTQLWCEQDKAHEFVDDLAKFYANPSLLAADDAAAQRMAATAASDDDGVDDAFMSKIAESIINDDDDEEVQQRRPLSTMRSASSSRVLLQTRSSSALGFDDILAEDGELKADAPLFVPGTSVRPCLQPRARLVDALASAVAFDSAAVPRQWLSCVDVRVEVHAAE